MLIFEGTCPVASHGIMKAPFCALVAADVAPQVEELKGEPGSSAGRDRQVGEALLPSSRRRGDLGALWGGERLVPLCCLSLSALALQLLLGLQWAMPGWS